MPLPGSVSQRLCDELEAATQEASEAERDGVITMREWRRLRARVTQGKALALRQDAQIRAGIALLRTGRISRDITREHGDDFTLPPAA